MVTVELSEKEVRLILGALEKDIEYGHYIGFTRKLIEVYDKVKKQSEENSVNQ